MLGLKLNHVSKRAPGHNVSTIPGHTTTVEMNTNIRNAKKPIYQISTAKFDNS